MSVSRAQYLPNKSPNGAKKAKREYRLSYIYCNTKIASNPHK